MLPRTAQVTPKVEPVSLRSPLRKSSLHNCQCFAGNLGHHFVLYNNMRTEALPVLRRKVICKPIAKLPVQGHAHTEYIPGSRHAGKHSGGGVALRKRMK